MKFLLKYFVRNESFVETASEIRYRTRDGRAFLFVAIFGLSLVGLLQAREAGSIMGLVVPLMFIPILTKLLWPTYVITSSLRHSLQVGYWFAGLIPRFETVDHTQVQSVAVVTHEVKLKDRLVKETFAPVLFLKSGAYRALPTFEDEALALRVTAAVAPGCVAATLTAESSVPYAKAQSDNLMRLFYRTIGFGAIGMVMIVAPTLDILLATFYEPENTYLANVIGEGETCEYSWSASKGNVYRIAPCDLTPEKPFAATSSNVNIKRLAELTVRFTDHDGQLQTEKIVVAKSVLPAVQNSGKLEVVFWPESKLRRLTRPTRDEVSFQKKLLGFGLLLLVLMEVAIRWFYPRNMVWVQPIS